ncbi:MAG: TerC/Alx family metal homeostasis membrane protein [Oligoflexia bacterium]|nr:TerC/Alx family metal homeostasis membrane protein [Oligoflexia bacterium]
MNNIIFTFADYWWVYVGFIVLVGFILILDLGVFHKNAHEVKFKEALGWSIFWVSFALVINWFFYRFSLLKLEGSPELIPQGLTTAVYAKQLAMEFLTGFVIEKSLAIDNIFLFIIVFQYFAIPSKYQHRILFFGIIGAVVFRAIFIAIGAKLMAYEAVVIFFGLFLIFTGAKMLFMSEQSIDPESNWFIKNLKKFIPLHPKIEGQKFFIKLGKIWYATPLFMALIFLEISDIIFAVDSVPAIYAITKEPMIVFISNILAILGLRAMFFLLSGSIERFKYIKVGLAFVLMFVGLKMTYLNHAFGGKFPISWSLLTITFFISSSILYSIWVDAKHKAAQEGKEK